MRILVLLVLLTASIGVTPLQAADEAPARIGYVRTAASWLADAAEGRMDVIGGRQVRWTQFQTSAEVALALDAGGIDAGLMSSAALAASVARGNDLRLFWVVNVVNARHVVIFRDGKGIDRTRPVTIAGKRIGVTFLSAAHEALLMAMAANGLSHGDVQLVNLAPSDMEAAWKSGRVDAVCLGGTRTAGVLAAMAGERVLLEPTAMSPFHAMVASSTFLAGNSQFLAALVRRLGRTAESSTGDTPRGRASRARIARDEESPVDTALYLFPSLEEQTGPDWLGHRGGAGSGIAERLAAVAGLVLSQDGRKRRPEDFDAVAARDVLTRPAVGGLR